MIEAGTVTPRGGRRANGSHHDSRIPVILPCAAVVALGEVPDFPIGIADELVEGTHERQSRVRRNVAAFAVFAADDYPPQSRDLLPPASRGDVPLDDLIDRRRLRRSARSGKERDQRQANGPHRDSSCRRKATESGRSAISLFDLLDGVG